MGISIENGDYIYIYIIIYILSGWDDIPYMKWKIKNV